MAAILQFLQTKLLQPKRQTGTRLDPTTNIIQKQMLYFLPAMTFIIGISLPAGLPLYWAVTTLFAIGQQWFIIRKQRPAS
jgi:YidC/Oxa1 family membrane protein insertase